MTAIEQARQARASFRLRKEIVLEDVADGKRTAIDAIETLERTFNAAAIRYYRSHASPHLRKAWDEYGPLEELLEVRRAYVSGEASWSALIERVSKAREERRRVG